MSNAYKKDGRKIMAATYEVLSKRNEERLTKLNEEYLNITNKLNTTVEKLSKDFPEIGQLI